MVEEQQSPPSQDTQSSPVSPAKENLPEEKPPIALKHRNPIIYLLVILVLFVFAYLVLSKLLYPNQTNQPSNITPQTQSIYLEINSPKEGEVALDGEILVSGKTLPNSTVIIFTDTDETSVESNGDGTFESTIVLTKGNNVLKVTAYGLDGQETSKMLQVFQET
ncbi:hypothetical protein HY407_04155 [Candidatus Gottesmanbacteria bacterium]|nr:hypothetical protein [Candidatus Gottesmanbacteria bacterium]